jgi:hypothetical protein
MTICFSATGKLLVAALCVGVVSGCATAPTTLYHWGDYQQQVYSRLKVDSSPEQQIQALEKTLQQNKHNQPIAPGMHAHLGLLYGEAGRRQEMCEQFATEKQLFPESAPFMDFLLAKAEAKGGKK